MGLKLVTAPSALPISLSDVRSRLDVTFSDNDEMIDGMMRAAVEAFDGRDGRLGRCLMPQTWDYYLDAFPKCDIRIPLPPLISVSSVNYVDTAGASQVLSTSDYSVDAAGYHGRVSPGDDGWPETKEIVNAVRIRFQAGYQTADSPPVPCVPWPIKQAILVTLRDMYDFRGSFVPGSIAQIPQSADRLIENFIVITA